MIVECLELKSTIIKPWSRQLLQQHFPFQWNNHVAHYIKIHENTWYGQSESGIIENQNNWCYIQKDK